KAELLPDLGKKPEAMRITASISLLLRRLLAGEESNPELFSEFVSGLKFLEQAEDSGDYTGIEAIIVLRLLSHLGYIGGGKVSEKLVASPLDRELVFEAKKQRTEILSEINRALRESQL
ncbi:MAG TPA: DNA repair protein RecO C-terminal domain-containing protein, partial [Candidatus Paceibacterota bacterium]|nr:DNA repair protein RecO C-terminal domain-containing protein [Candidatus Paceibacterota bacterium]